MIEKTIKVVDLHSEQVSDAEFWKYRPVEEIVKRAAHRVHPKLPAAMDAFKSYMEGLRLE
jgi:hypothetical protein